jgi:WD40 repeat protein
MNDPKVILWDVEAGEHLRTLESAYTLSLAFSPHGAMLAAGSFDGRVILWEAETGELLRTFEGHSSPVYSVAFSPDGATLASGSSDGTVILWDVAP